MVVVVFQSPDFIQGSHRMHRNITHTKLAKLAKLLCTQESFWHLRLLQPRVYDRKVIHTGSNQVSTGVISILQWSSQLKDQCSHPLYPHPRYILFPGCHCPYPSLLSLLDNNEDNCGVEYMFSMCIQQCRWFLRWCVLVVVEGGNDPRQMPPSSKLKSSLHGDVGVRTLLLTMTTIWQVQEKDIDHHHSATDNDVANSNPNILDGAADNNAQHQGQWQIGGEATTLIYLLTGGDMVMTTSA